MTEQLKTIINRLEQHIQNAYETDDENEFAELANKLCDELEDTGNSFEAIEPILELIERSPDIDYGGPGPLAHLMESYYKKGYEELLFKSIERKPTEYTLFLLHRVINDEDNPNHQLYLDLMRKVSLNLDYPENIITNAKDSLTYFQ
ncbi:MAG: hypothetical protein ACK5Z2_18635 [Bacteroidota bacterium]|jgi:hypothetical protein